MSVESKNPLKRDQALNDATSGQIGLLLSLSVSTNAQASSGYTSIGGSDSGTGVKQMGICVVGVESL